MAQVQAKYVQLHEVKESPPSVTPTVRIPVKGEINNIYINGIICLIVSLIIVSAAYLLNKGSILNNPQISGATITATGISIFAVFYIMAQLIERIVDPFSNTHFFGVKSITEPKDGQVASGEADAISSFNNARIISLWLAASALGILLCYFTVGMLGIIGFTFSISPLQGHLVDAIISGLIIGGGTKPLHDLINLFDVSGNSKTSS
jgi:hypothetical protein